VNFDILLVGGGPSGLSLACALAGSGLNIAILERQAAAQLAAPSFDGREIALTHRSAATLQDLGAWSHIPAADIHPLVRAQVLNGGARASLDFLPGNNRVQALGQLVSNHHIRGALFRASETLPDVTLIDNAAVAHARADATGADVTLADGQMFTARLLVAADSRFSSLRQHLGIGAEVNRLGRAMMVCRVTHERPHHGIATEWFDHGQTLALLPLGPGQSSAVLTVSQEEADHLAAMDDAALAVSSRVATAAAGAPCPLPAPVTFIRW